MSSAGPNNPGTLVSDAGVGTIPWTSPGNASASDDSRATASVSVSDPNTEYLKATNFGFSVVSSSIDGIVVEIERSASGATNIKDNIVRLVKGGTVQGADKASASNWPTTDAYATYGGSSDLWGLTFVDADVNASNFGVVISAAWVAATLPEARIDHIRITIHYTAPAGHPAGRRLSQTRYCRAVEIGRIGVAVA